MRRSCRRTPGAPPVTEPPGAPAGTGPAAHSPFAVGHLHQGLERRSVRGGAVTLASQATRFVLGTGSTVVLARLLTPADFGLIAMVAPITGFIGLFKDLGLSMATVQRESVTHDQVSTLFWVNVALSLALMAVTMAIAPAVGAFYGDPRATLVTVALAALFLFGGLTAQQQALIQRQMQFGRLATVEIVSLAAGVAAGIAAAWQGFGYWALVVLQATSAAITMMMVWLISGWRPGRPRRGAGIRSMIRFGGGLTGFNVVNYLARNLDNVLIGRFIGAGALGLYSRAYGLLLLPIRLIRSPISAVAVPSLSRLQGDAPRYRRYVRKALALITFLSMPLVGFSAVAAEHIILLVLGEQWVGAVTVFRVLAFAALVQSFNVVTGWVYTSLGQTVRWFRWGLFSSTVIAASFVVGLPWGIEGVAVAYTAAVYLLFYPSLWFCFRRAPVSPGDIAAVVWRPLVATAVSAGVLLLLAPDVLTRAPLAATLAGELALFGVTYAVAWIIIPGGPDYLRELARTARRAMGREVHDSEAGIRGGV